MQQKKILEYQPDPNKFDLRTHVWDTQGHLVKKNLYRAFIVNGTTYYERPVNSGNLWFENNQPAGRVEITFGENGKISKKEFKLGEAHKDFTPPLQGAEKLHYELEQERAKAQELAAELAAIKAEREAKQPSAPKEEAKPEVKVPRLTK